MGSWGDLRQVLLEVWKFSENELEKNVPIMVIKYLAIFRLRFKCI
jgi:hypothetical protein